MQEAEYQIGPRILFYSDKLAEPMLKFNFIYVPKKKEHILFSCETVLASMSIGYS